MRYALIREMDISNGEGIGISLFVQGCHFHCKGCFNQETWDFNAGKEWTAEAENKFIELSQRAYVRRISLLGGEPLADENVQTVLDVVRKIKSICPSKPIWIYTGYIWEDIISLADKTPYGNARMQLVQLADIIVDGKFDVKKQDIGHRQIRWAGSTNQRVIDVANTIGTGHIIVKNS